MIKLFLIIHLFVYALIAKEDIDKKIKLTASKISTFSKNYTTLNKKMAKNAKAILNKRLNIQKQQKFLKNLVVQLLDKELSYKENKVELKDLMQHNEKLKNRQNIIEEELIFVIAQSVTFSVILEDNYSVDEESLMEFEILHEMLQYSKEKAALLNDKFYNNSKDIEKLNKQSKSLKQAIDNIDKKRKKLSSTQKSNKIALKKLKADKNSYKRKLKKLLSKHDELKKTLSHLNIIKIDEIKKTKEEKKRQIAFNKKAFEKEKELEDYNLPKVKKHGSSYQAIKTKRYKGIKTIAPLDSYSIIKQYGTYTDPIYGIKIFNESISLKPKKKNSKVKTVFNGKVIYADKTAVLNNIVIIEHRNGLHTIYANLSQISPNIKKGKKIKKGYSIGRVNDELIFEVTQKSYHINPIRLFQ